MKNLSKMGIATLLIAISFFSCDPPKSTTSAAPIDSLKKDSSKVDSVKKDSITKKDTTKKK